VVDDLEMKISHVIRGEDHLSNTPKHIEIIRALGATPPHYAHIPLILNRDGSKMSKRDEGARVEYYIRRGYLPEAVRNYLCLLGWSPKDNREKLDIDEIIRIFDLKNIGRSSATFDTDKLYWLNGEYMLALPLREFVELSKDYLCKHFPNFDAVLTVRGEDYVNEAIATCYRKIKSFHELIPYAEFYFTGDITYDSATSQKHFVPANEARLKAVLEALDRLKDFGPVSIEAAIKSVASDLHVKVATLVHPTRLATTGKPAGPSLYELLSKLGLHAVATRLDRAIDWIQFLQPTVVTIGPNKELLPFPLDRFELGKLEDTDTDSDAPEADI
jgi:glutamyl-tRNA synthetase